MKATTIKLEQNLLEQIYEMMPSGQSLSRFVKDILQKEVLRIKMSKAAHSYNQFLKDNADEAESEEAWEQADLLSEPRTKKKK